MFVCFWFLLTNNALLSQVWADHASTYYGGFFVSIMVGTRLYFLLNLFYSSELFETMIGDRAFPSLFVIEKNYL